MWQLLISLMRFYSDEPWNAVPGPALAPWAWAAPALLSVLAIAALHAARSFVVWHRHFEKGRRFPRAHRTCPSHREAPAVRRRGPSTSSAPPRRSVLRREPSSFGPETAERLDMDHIRLSFPSFLWAMFFVWPAMMFAGLRGVVALRIRSSLFRRGLAHPLPFDPAHVCYDACVNSTLAIYFVGFDGDGNAVYHFDSLPIVNDKDECEIRERMELRVDLKSKRLASAVLDPGELLSASETLTMLYFYWVSAHHVKIHSLANWAMLCEESTLPACEQSSFAARNRNCTVVYNYFGYTSFGQLIPYFQALGLLSSGFRASALRKVFDHGLSSGIFEHSDVVRLAKHSPIVRFIVKVRSIFIAEFAKHKDSFPGCNVEALFAGTVLHSLDHSSNGWVLKDTLWLDIDSPRFGRMAEIGRIVRAGFNDDLPGLAFHKSFRNSGHPFYEAVYRG